MESENDPPATEDTLQIEAWLVSKILKRGITALSNDEVSLAFHSRVFSREWQKATGQATLPEKIRAQMMERISKHLGPSRTSIAPPVSSSTTKITPIAPNGESMTASIVAGDVDTIRDMLTRSSDIRRLLEPPDTSNRTSLHLASREGKVEIVQLLVDFGAPLEARDTTGRTPLHVACEYGQTTCAMLLLHLGSNPEAEDSVGRNVFHLACCCDAPDLPLQLLSRRPSLLTSCDRYSRTGLFYAVLNLNLSASGEIAKSLLDRKAEPNARDALGRTALHYAAEEGRLAAVSLLLKSGADVTVRDSAGKSPAEVSGSEAVREEIRKRVSAPARGAAPGEPDDMQPVWKEKLLRMMTRAQEGGLQQLEHLKQPLLFSGAWLDGVSSVGELFGKTLRSISGPEAAFRVFNVICPPRAFPKLRGDESEISKVFRWDEGSDPFASLGASPVVSDESARRILELRADLETREKLIAQLHSEVTELKRIMDASVPAVDLKVAKEDAARLRQDVTRCEMLLKETQRQAQFTDQRQRALSATLEEKERERSNMFVQLATSQELVRQLSQDTAEKQVLQEQLQRAQATIDSLNLEKGTLLAGMGKERVVEAVEKKETADWKTLYMDEVKRRVTSNMPAVSRLLGLASPPAELEPAPLGRRAGTICLTVVGACIAGGENSFAVASLPGAGLCRTNSAPGKLPIWIESRNFQVDWDQNETKSVTFQLRQETGSHAIIAENLEIPFVLAEQSWNAPFREQSLLNFPNGYLTTEFTWIPRGANLQHPRDAQLLSKIGGILQGRLKISFVGISGERSAGEFGNYCILKTRRNAEETDLWKSPILSPSEEQWSIPELHAVSINFTQFPQTYDDIAVIEYWASESSGDRLVSTAPLFREKPITEPAVCPVVIGNATLTVAVDFEAWFN